MHLKTWAQSAGVPVGICEGEGVLEGNDERVARRVPLKVKLAAAEGVLNK